MFLKRRANMRIAQFSKRLNKHHKCLLNVQTQCDCQCQYGKESCIGQTGDQKTVLEASIKLLIRVHLHLVKGQGLSATYTQTTNGSIHHPQKIPSYDWELMNELMGHSKNDCSTALSSRPCLRLTNDQGNHSLTTHLRGFRALVAYCSE